MKAISYRGYQARSCTWECDDGDRGEACPAGCGNWQKAVVELLNPSAMGKMLLELIWAEQANALRTNLKK